MVNSELLDKYITDSGLRVGYIVEKLGISRQAFDKKRKGATPFKAAEIFVLCVLLNISEADKTLIFYPEVIKNDNLKEVFA